MKPTENKDKAADAAQPKTQRCLVLISIVVAVFALVIAFGTFVNGIIGDAAKMDGTIQAAQETSSEADSNASKTADGTAVSVCNHDWTITYKTVHHDAETHTETVEPVYANETSYHTVCNDCKQTIDGIADAHIEETGHSGYSTNVPIVNEVLVSEGYTHVVTDKAAYDETLPDKVICTLCGEVQDVESSNVASTEE